MKAIQLKIRYEFSFEKLPNFDIDFRLLKKKDPPTGGSSHIQEKQKHQR